MAAGAARYTTLDGSERALMLVMIIHCQKNPHVEISSLSHVNFHAGATQRGGQMYGQVFEFCFVSSYEKDA